MRLIAAASLLACAVFTSSCTDTTSIPSAPRTRPLTPVRASMSPRQSGPRVHPNSEKYRDSGHHAGTGQEGTAVIQVRSLIDKSSTTDVDVTTGTFDGGPPTGTLSKVQLKAYTASGKHVFTDNYDQLSGTTASFPYTRLARGMPLQVTAKVQSLDGDEDVVALDTVRLRPDLIPWRLQGPDQAPLGTAVNFQAFIMERNGDVGARADCVLYVDGAAVDRATDIWVDAGGEVACAMTHVFTEARTYSLELRVENVRPRDFDDTNNSLTRSITIVTPSVFAFYDFQAWSVTDSAWWHSVSTLTQWDGTVETWDQIYTRQGVTQFASFSGLIPRVLDYTAPIRFQGAMSTNGATVNTVDDTYPPLPYVDWQGGYCSYFYNFATRGVTYLCVYPQTGYTYVQYDWSGANVHYHSDSYVYYWDASGQLHQTWYSDDYSDVAPMVTLGPDFSGWVSVQGVNDPEPLTAQATVRFDPVDLRFDYVDPSCSTTPASPGCFELHDHTWGSMGYVQYGSWPPSTP